MSGKALPRNRGGFIGHLKKHWLVYAAVIVICGVVWTVNDDIQTSQADGRARDSAIAARAGQVSELTKGGITVYDKSKHRYRWNSETHIVKVRVRVGQCDIDGEFSLTRVRPETSADISKLRFTVPGENQDAPNADVEVTKDSLPRLYATLRSSGMRQCVAGDERFFAPVSE
jgi:hypothetical protein